MPFDGKVLDVAATTDRARFAADLARHANEPYGVQLKGNKCALARFFGGSHAPWPFEENDQCGDKHVYGTRSWQTKFMRRYDDLARQPTGFDCLCILNSIP